MPFDIPLPLGMGLPQMPQQQQLDPIAQLIQAGIDPNMIAALLQEAQKAKQQQQQLPPTPMGMPAMPPMPQPPQGEMRNAQRPGDAMMPVSQMLAETAAGPPGMAYQGGQAIGEGLQAGSPGDIAGGMGLTALAMSPFGGRAPKKRLPPAARFDDADTSHVGMIPWATMGLGAAGGAYMGSKLDDQDNTFGPAAISGGLLGGGLGLGFGVLPVLQHIRKIDEAEKAATLEERMRRQASEAAAAQRARQPAQPTAPAQAPRPPLTERLRQGREAVPEPKTQTDKTPWGHRNPKTGRWSKKTSMPFGLALPDLV